MINITRRDFLKLTNYTLLTSALALNFGCAIKPLVKDKNKKIALIYATRYGATQDTAQWIVDGMQRDVDLLNIENISFELTAKKYDYIIIGSGIWIDGVHKDILKFFKTQKKHLRGKIIASFILCGTTSKDVQGEARIAQYFDKFHKDLEELPPLNEQFGGRLRIDTLNAKDKKLLKNFYEKVLKREFKSWDRTQPKKALHFAKLNGKFLNSV